MNGQEKQKNSKEGSSKVYGNNLEIIPKVDTLCAYHGSGQRVGVLEGQEPKEPGRVGLQQTPTGTWKGAV